MIRYRLFDHTADIGVEVFGATINELFVNGAFALFDLLTNLDKLRRTVEYNVTATGEDLNDLWVNYLRECLYLWSSEGFLAVGCTVTSIDKQRVAAKMQGEVFDSARHIIKQEIKAVTYHHASVITTPQGWAGRVIFDV
jgi:SHS2 domain-containing protein